MKEKQDLIAKVALSTDHIVVVTDATGYIEWVNDGFTKLTEYTLEEVKGKKPGDILQGPETNKIVVEELSLAIKRGVPITKEILNYSKSGREYWLHMNIQPIFDKNEKLSHFMAIEVDLTKQKEEEIRLQNLAVTLKNTIAQRDKYFSILSHDLRSPFLGYINLLQVFHDDVINLNPEEIKEATHSLIKELETMKNHIDGLLTWSLHQREMTQPCKSIIQLKKMVPKVFKVIEKAAQIKNIDLVFNAEQDIAIYADENMIQSTLINLLSNAIKFSENGSEVHLEMHEAKNEATLKVIDRGVGMTEKKKESLLDGMINSSTPGTKSEKGTGLGLSLCYEFVKTNDGQIKCNSAPGKGTTFTLTFPSVLQTKNQISKTLDAEHSA